MLSLGVADRILTGVTVYRVPLAFRIFMFPCGMYKRREVERMDTYEVLTLLFLGGTFLVALLAYLDNRNNKPKK